MIGAAIILKVDVVGKYTVIVSATVHARADEDVKLIVQVEVAPA
jgi:hypothetical protein